MPTIMNKNPDDDSGNGHALVVIKGEGTVTALYDIQLSYPSLSLLFN